ncbi:uncharacterized protein LOC144490528, partial [Mustelus asterias]
SDMESNRSVRSCFLQTINMRWWNQIERGANCYYRTEKLVFGKGTKLTVEPNVLAPELCNLSLAEATNSLCDPIRHLKTYLNRRFLSEQLLLCYDKLTFGNGTQVTVVPKAKGPVEPKLSVFYPPVPRGATGIDTAAVCLASDFSPNAIMLSLYTGSGQEVNVTRSSVLLESGNYRSSGFLSFRQSEKSPNITCKAFHDNRNYSVNIPPTVEIDKPKCPTGRSDSLTESSDTENDRLRVNFLSLTVMGLRILFFKSIVFNVMMTARVWLF